MVSFFLSDPFPIQAYDKPSIYQEDTTLISQLLVNAISKYHHDFDRALSDTHHALELSQKHNDKEWMVKSYHRMGRIYEANNRINEALFYYQNELGLVNEVNDKLKIDIYFDLAKIYSKSGSYVQSRINYLKVIELSEHIYNHKMKHLAFAGLGDLYSLVNDYEKAADYNLQSIQLAEKVGSVKDECIGYRQLAILYQKAGNAELSFKYANKAYNLLSEIKDTQIIVLTHFAYAHSLNLMKRHAGALMYFEKTMKLVEQYGDKTNIAKANLYLAETYNLMGYKLKAEYFFHETLKYTDFIETYDLAKYYYEHGIFHLQNLEKNEESLTYLELCLQTAIKNNYKDLIQKAHFSLSKYHEKVAQSDWAFIHLKAAYAYLDTLKKDENLKRIAEAQFKFDIGRAEKKVQSIEQEKIVIIAIAVVTLLLLCIVGMYFFMRTHKEKSDMMAQKNQEIQHQIQLLAESNEVLKQFAYISAHDLKEPLRSISSFVHIIQKRYVKGLPPEANEYMNFVTSGVKRMENLLSALLEYSTVVVENKKTIQVTPIQQVIKEIIQNLHHSIVQQKAIIRYPSVLPDILMSRVHLTQLIQNLVANAIKFSENQPIVEIGFLRQHQTIVLYVKDNGIGIREEYGEKVFKIFQRLDRSMRYEGTGIGLSICKSLVDKYGGKIWFDSKADQGTTFFMSFPDNIFSEIPDLADVTMVTYDSDVPIIALK